MHQQPLKPQQLFKYLLQCDFKEASCSQAPHSDRVHVAQQKSRLKSEITAAQRSKSEYIQLLEKQQRIKSQLKMLLNYRDNIDYEHKYKRIKFDHYQFPYSDNLALKQTLNTLREQNSEKKRKIRDLEEEIKLKQRHTEQRRIQKQNLAFASFKNQNVPSREDGSQQNLWIQRIENMKRRHLNQDQDFKRAKIKHDYNLLVERQLCACRPNRTCIICSDLNLQEKVSYTKQALTSPRYSRIYPRTKF